MEPNGNQMPIIVSDKNELRRCVMHLWRNYNGLGLNLKNSKTEGRTPHVIRDVDPDSPAQYGGVLNNDFIIKVGNKVVEHEKFDSVLKLIKDQLKKYKKADLLLLNAAFYAEFKSKNEVPGKKIDYNSPRIVSQIKYYESPLFNPNSTSNTLMNANTLGSPSYHTLTHSSANFSDSPPEPRLCHLLTWSSYDGYGFYVAYNNEGCYVKNVEPNSPAQLGGLRAYDRIIEINGRSVDSKDKDFIMRQINKHKKLQIYGTTNKINATLKSQSAYSVATTKSNKSTKSGLQSAAKYLNILVADPFTYKFLMQKKIDVSTKNRNLKIQECYTPPESHLNNLVDQSTISSPRLQTQLTNHNDDELTTSKHNISINSNNIATKSSEDFLKAILIKLCTIRRLRGRESEPLGFEMTKRGTQAHFISRVEPGSAADLSGLALNDYLIELNDKNVEQDENSLLREKIFNSLEPHNGGEFKLLTINKAGYDYCLENKIPISGFIQINKQNIERYETPNIETNMNNVTSITVSSPTTSTHQISDVVIRPQTPAVVEEHKKYTGIPRLCILRKTKEINELGLSIARMKNINEHIINDVVPGSLADKAGLRPNDCLLEVNGENVENKSHIETVNRIIELAKYPNAEISLLVIERLPIITTTPSNTLKSSSALNTPNLASKSSPHISIENYSSVNHSSKSTQDYMYSTVRIAESNAVQPPSTDLPSLNAYPEIKLCEFVGYPTGTQLGLVVTSDEYSHDVVKVAEDSPAQKVGIIKGDVILAVNDQSVEGSAKSIEQLNDFSETRPLKVLVASRYAYEWSKLLRIRINEKDWPNIKRIHTKYVPVNNVKQINPSIYSQSATKIYQETYETRPKQIYHHDSQYEQATELDMSAYDYQHNYLTQPRRNHNEIMSHLCRSAVDITADGKVLRMCTLFLDPNSPNPADAEFGFDLVTKVGGGQRCGDYFIDTVDEDSPAHTSGLKTGDRLVEVDGIDVKNKTFEEVVYLINEAKLRCRLKLLVYPSVVINYGNPHISNMREQEEIIMQNTQQLSNAYVDARSMPDLAYEEHVVQNSFHNANISTNNSSSTNCNNHNHNNLIVHNYDPSTSRSASSSKKTIHQQFTTLTSTTTNVNDYDTIYLKKPSNLNLSKSSSNIYGNTLNSSSLLQSDTNSFNQNNDLLRPLPRLCTLFKNDASLSNSSSSNIGFGVQTKQTSAIIPNFLRVSIVNYKSAAYLAGLETGDFIVEVNGRNTLSMSHEEALQLIKQSYDVNNYVRLLVVNTFTYNWLKEHDLLSTIRSDDPSVFSYADYLKNNHRYVPRLCKIKLFPFSKSFGFSIETLQIRPSSALISANKAAAYQSFAHIVTKVERDSAAFAASLQKGDRIIECDGINVEAESEQQIMDRITQAFANAKQITLFVVDPDTDNFFKSKCIRLHQYLPIVQHITNSVIV